MIPETVHFNELTRLIDREDFINVDHEHVDEVRLRL
jgi:hypothetical protein